MNFNQKNTDRLIQKGQPNHSKEEKIEYRYTSALIGNRQYYLVVSVKVMQNNDIFIIDISARDEESKAFFD